MAIAVIECSFLRRRLIKRLIDGRSFPCVRFFRDSLIKSDGGAGGREVRQSWKYPLIFRGSEEHALLSVKVRRLLRANFIRRRVEECRRIGQLRQRSLGSLIAQTRFPLRQYAALYRSVSSILFNFAASRSSFFPSASARIWPSSLTLTSWVTAGGSSNSTG